MLLSIITITYNNLSGLQRTIASVQQQTFSDYEQIVIDGASTDGTPDYLKTTKVRYVSEQDKGIYDAQNKGIALAKGDYCFFLNAGDTFCSPTVLERMFCDLPSPHPDILYGNELVTNANGKVVETAKGIPNPSFVDLYNSCMKHQATFIHRVLFEQYGDYDTSLRICADFDWFFRVIAFHDEVTLLYRDIDISFFENTGLSYHAPGLCRMERQIVLDRYLPTKIQSDLNLMSRTPALMHLSDVKGWRNRVANALMRTANRMLRYKCNR